MTRKNKRRFILLGAGGHGKVVVEALRSVKREPFACLDPNQKLWGRKFEDIPVEGGDDRISDYSPRNAALANGVGAPVDTSLRQKVYESFCAKGYDFPSIIAASALCSASASIRNGAQILTRAVVHPGAVVGANAIVNTGAIVEHDCEIGDHAHICPGAILCGGVKVGAGAFVGAGAMVLPYVSIGPKAVVAAGVVVRKDVPKAGRVLPN